MWMMGYNEGGELNMNMGVEQFNNGGSRKLKPLVPRPSPPHHGASSSNRFHPTAHDHLLALNHHLVTAAEQSKRDFNSQQVVVSSRWNPTPEQLQTLEELYRRGTRTPSADEIQNITTQLRHYGKIEGKNVFYWFQNHKARERQKRRRGQLESSMNHDLPPFPTTDFTTINIIDHQPIERKESEVNRTGYEVEETRNWGIPTNCSTFSEKHMSREKTTRAALMAECRATPGGADDGWEAIEQQEEGSDQLLLLQRRRRSCFTERNPTWHHTMQCFSSSSSPSSLPHTGSTLINSTATCTAAAATVSSTSTASTMKIPSNVTVSPYRQYHYLGHDVESYQTLQLFPVDNRGHGGERAEQADKCCLCTSDVDVSPRRFIEFLPLKN